jgi:quercetin dioxygenase-like cupin family protein
MYAADPVLEPRAWHCKESERGGDARSGVERGVLRALKSRRALAWPRTGLTQAATRRTVTRVTSEYLVEPQTARRLQLGGMGLTVEVANERLSGRAAAMRIRLDGRRVIPPHLHRREDEVTFVLRGPVGVQVGDEEFEAPTGSVVVGPKDLFHAYWSPVDDPLEFLTFITPGGIERFFEEFQSAFDSLDSEGIDPSDVAARRAMLADRYGLCALPRATRRFARAIQSSTAGRLNELSVGE